ncbi:phosphodiester glycosidase family protein [Paenibacillus sp. N4]|uniref:phosphodiester glycosidase family protein n=1 Tax=Paenibacillus vietnamensis TaxID=2590547 RepID=UPI001CD0F608|nr:phosphodiester glycosidase family protein [Paenibacillus vietnamensis]MCA0756574.1 phosphodiester glycosidase family protein [Paenibacillus vietnamensis]
MTISLRKSDHVLHKELITIAPLNRKKKTLLILASTLLAVGLILYKLADRYLIEHVEATVPATQSAGTAADADDKEKSASESAPVSQDDWNYNSGDIIIAVEKAETGSGSDKITYFVADVQLKDSSSLKAAFAKNSFGRNIIENTSVIAAANNAIFAINGDYYGFRSNGVIIRDGILYRDEPARDALAIFQDGTMQAYNEEEVSSAELLAQQVSHTYSFGPVLVDDGAVSDDLDQVSIDTNFGNRSIQSSNPRTGIGMIAPNHFVFVVVDGRMENYSKGMTLTEFAQLFAELGATEAYNLDGGGSSTMYFMGRVVNNPLGKQKERGVSDILYLAEPT